MSSIVVAESPFIAVCPSTEATEYFAAQSPRLRARLEEAGFGARALWSGQSPEAAEEALTACAAVMCANNATFRGIPDYVGEAPVDYFKRGSELEVPTLLFGSMPEAPASRVRVLERLGVVALGKDLLMLGDILREKERV